MRERQRDVTIPLCQITHYRVQKAGHPGTVALYVIRVHNIVLSVGWYE
jgi:hypothetical protein